jgi:5,6-dimethylbenzimidazole synthase
MDVFTAIENRTSCRQFLSEKISAETIDRLIKAATRAPSPLNTQPWQFLIITTEAMKQKIFEEAERCRHWAIEEIGWKWLNSYKTDFLLQAPVLVVVVGDPSKTGMDMFQKEGNVGYQLACAAAIQNMMLAAHALDLGSLFFTMFDKSKLRTILDIATDKTPVALVCIGKPKEACKPIPRKEVEKKTLYLK